MHMLTHTQMKDTTTKPVKKGLLTVEVLLVSRRFGIVVAYRDVNGDFSFLDRQR